MAAQGTITIDLLANTGSFETDLNRAAKAAERRAKEIEKTFAGIGTAVGAGIAAAGAAVAVIGTQAIDQLAQLDDMTQKTGASVENLSRIQQTASAFGQDFNEVDAAISRLAKGMATVDSETNKTQKALAALGLSARDASGALRDPSELLVDIAKALQGYEDGASKAALANDLFGKSGAALLPFLNDLSENVDRFKGVSKEAAAEAAAFQDRLNGMKAEFQTLAQSIAGDVLPYLNRFLETVNTIRRTSLTGWLFSSGDDEANPGEKLKDIDRRLADIAKSKAELASGGGIAERIFGNTNDYDRIEKNLKNQKEYLQGIQALQALTKKGAPDQVDRMMASQNAKQVLDYTTGNAPKSPSVRVSIPKESQYDKDLAAANKLIESLKSQVETFGQSEAAALKYKLTLQGLPQPIIDSAAALRQQIEDMRDGQRAVEAMADEQERLEESYRFAAESIAASLMTAEQAENDSYNRRIEALQNYGALSAEAQAEANQLMEAENERHQLAMKQMQTAANLQAVTATANTFDQMYQLFVQAGNEQSALAKTLFLASKALAVAEIILNTELGAAKAIGQFGPFGIPMSAVIRATGYAQAGMVAGLAIAGAREDGGPVDPNRPYLVGEAGPEIVIPRRAGTVIPNHMLGDATGNNKITIVNNTRGRIDTVTERRISANERALIIDEAIGAVAADMSNPNGRVSRAQSRNYSNMQRTR